MTWSFSLMDAASCCEDDGQVAAVVSLPARQSSGCDWTSRGSGVVTHDVKGHQKASCFLSKYNSGVRHPAAFICEAWDENLHVLHADAIANAATMRCGKLRVHNASCSTRNISSTSTSLLKTNTTRVTSKILQSVMPNKMSLRLRSSKTSSRRTRRQQPPQKKRH